ncbi:MAG TPA: septal ring lytic transglycosylase RlpA family protein [Nevskiaceae bacterium]|nr:septal ring lytic transglycosylase RlpA family protein [Nevskiaceae bacterium]
MARAARGSALRWAFAVAPLLALAGCGTQALRPVTGPPQVVISAVAPAALPQTGGAPAQNPTRGSAVEPPPQPPVSTSQREPLSTRGNPAQYTVRGKTYHVLDSSEGFTSVGYASWYGTKFQGRRTASGERYNMHLMTAASPRLPIPSYVKVTNLRNGESAVVRVNDRGPFHSKRIIDLSFAAAKKIGMLGHGTAKVRLEALTPVAPASPRVPPQLAANDGHLVKVARRVSHAAPLPLPPPSGVDAAADQRFLQVGVFLDHSYAEAVQARLQGSGVAPLHLVAADFAGTPAVRVLVGPVDAGSQLHAMRQQLADDGFPSAIVSP